MTIAELLNQAMTLSPQERKELAKLLIDTLDVPEDQHLMEQPKTGAEIAAMLRSMEPIAFIDPQIEDPVEWVKAQRSKRSDKLNADRYGDIEA